MSKAKGIFKVEIRKDCKVCGGDITEKRFRTFCSTICREKHIYKKQYGYTLQWSRRKRGEYKPGKVKCGICGWWYVQVITHVIERHKMSGEEYREKLDLPYKRGIVPEWYHDMKSEITKENGTISNLESGAHMRYKEGDPRARELKGWKGRRGNKGYTGDFT